MSEFDDIFKKGLENYEIKVPEDIWSRIEPNIETKRNYKPFFILGSIIVLITFSSCFWYIFSETKSEEFVEKDKFAGESLLANKFEYDKLDQFLVAKSTFNEDIADIRDENANSSVSIRSDIKSQIFEESSVNKTIIDKEKTQLNIDKRINVLKTNLQESINEAFIEKNIDLVSLPNFQKSTLQFTLPEYDKKCPKFGKSRTGFFSVEAFHASDYNIKTLVAKSNEFDEYVIARNNTEKKMYSYSDGLRVKWHNNSGFGIGLGFERSVIRELFEFVDPTAREVKVLISIDTLFNPNGTFVTNQDTTRIEVNGTMRNMINNRYVSIDFPFSLSYQIELRRWAIGINAGVNLNLLFNQKGRILGLNNKPAWINSDNSNELDAYRAKSGLKFDGSLSIIYHLTSNVDILAEPYFRFNGNSLTKEKYNLDHYNNTIGIRTGIRYNFGF